MEKEKELFFVDCASLLCLKTSFAVRPLDLSKVVKPAHVKDKFKLANAFLSKAVQAHKLTQHDNNTSCLV